MNGAVRGLVLCGYVLGLSACGGIEGPVVPDNLPGVLHVPSTATTTKLSFTQIEIGLNNGCGVAADGLAYCWGSNIDLQLGNAGPFQRSNGTDCSDTPLRVAGIPAAAKVTVGDRHACALAASGETWCWGRGTNGELGQGVAQDSVLPVQVQTQQRFVQISAGSFSCGRTGSGDIYCWGAAGASGVGSGSGGNALLPTRIASNLAFREVAVGGSSACAVTEDGAVYCWGSNSEGQLGTGNSSGSATPSLVGGVLGGLDVSAVDISGDHACAIAGNRAYCWGRKLATGEPDASNPQLEPIAVRTDQQFVSVSAGVGYNCATASDDVAWCWGLNSFYTLGDGTADDRRTPVRAKTSARFRQVAAGGFSTCALTASGQPYCWGWNWDGRALRPIKK